MTRRGDDLSERVLDFAARIGKVVDKLLETRLGRHVAGQLVRCGTSPAPNYTEACGAESRKDFVHKLSICLKELRETHCWLQMIVSADLLPESAVSGLVAENVELGKIVARSIITAKGNASRP